jgi:GTPase SAR1 family protein
MNLKTIKMGLIGESKTGKTTLARFFASNGACLSRDYHLTSGVEVFTKILTTVKNPEQSASFLGAENEVQITELECQGLAEHVKVKIYDFGGSEIYHEPIVFPVLEQLRDFVIVYDVGRRESLEAVDKWLRIIKERVPNPGKLMLLGNVYGEEREVTEEEAREYARSKGLGYWETGIKDYGAVDQVFKDLFQGMLVNS